MVRTLRDEADLGAGDGSLDGLERPGPDGCPRRGGGNEFATLGVRAVRDVVPRPHVGLTFVSCSDDM